MGFDSVIADPRIDRSRPAGRSSGERGIFDFTMIALPFLI